LSVAAGVNVSVVDVAPTILVKVAPLSVLTCRSAACQPAAAALHL
jgi:hypothetical protein